MDYSSFKNKYCDLPIITTKDILQDRENVQVLRNQLNRWHKKGLIQRLRKGIFVFNKADRKKNLNVCYIANRIYEPSYVSLEYALNYYDLIPEGVRDITSVSTQKTSIFENDFGRFVYQHVKPSAFRGFTQISIDSSIVFMAEPEKAVVDFFYLNLSKFSKNVKDVIMNSYRFQNFEELSIPRLKELAMVFKCKKLTKVTSLFCELIEE